MVRHPDVAALATIWGEWRNTPRRVVKTMVSDASFVRITGHNEEFAAKSPADFLFTVFDSGRRPVQVDCPTVLTSHLEPLWLHAVQIFQPELKHIHLGIQRCVAIAYYYGWREPNPVALRSPDLL